MTRYFRNQIAAVLAGLTLSLAPGTANLAAAETRYEPKWESLDKRPSPAWFLDAKFGIFIHWGLYSVPGWGVKGEYAEWYWNKMHDQKAANPWWQYHQRVYGEKFDYADFAPLFRAENFDPPNTTKAFVFGRAPRRPKPGDARGMPSKPAPSAT
jgi:alpha-L-fucosidase